MNQFSENLPDEKEIMRNIHLLEVVVIHQNNQKLLNVKIYLNSYRHPANMTDHGTSTQLSQ